MKKHITTCVLAAFAINANAQLVTISQTHQLPAAGDTIHYVDANSFGFDPIGTGPVTNKLWDNSMLLNTGTTYDFYWVDTADVLPGYAKDSFPTANIARGESGAAGYFYYQNTANDINRIGWYGSLSNYGIYDNASFATEFHFPITAGNTVTTSYTGRYAPWGVGEDSVKIEMASLSINADMQGTLMLPTGTFTSVLRLHVLESFHIRTYILGTPALDNLIEDDYYYWFVDTVLQALLVSGTTKVDGTVQNTVLRYQPVTSTTGIIENNLQALAISPNPSKGIFKINNLNSHSANYTLEIFDALGQTVNYSISKQPASASIDISNAPKGVYTVKLTADNKTLTQKLVISE